jgi:hypothetical protein
MAWDASVILASASGLRPPARAASAMQWRRWSSRSVELPQLELLGLVGGDQAGPSATVSKADV